MIFRDKEIERPNAEPRTRNTEHGTRNAERETRNTELFNQFCLFNFATINFLFSPFQNYTHPLPVQSVPVEYLHILPQYQNRHNGK